MGQFARRYHGEGCIFWTRLDASACDLLGRLRCFNVHRVVCGCEPCLDSLQRCDIVEILPGRWTESDKMRKSNRRAISNMSTCGKECYVESHFCNCITDKCEPLTDIRPCNPDEHGICSGTICTTGQVGSQCYMDSDCWLPEDNRRCGNGDGRGGGDNLCHYFCDPGSDKVCTGKFQKTRCSAHQIGDDCCVDADCWQGASSWCDTGTNKCSVRGAIK